MDAIPDWKHSTEVNFFQRSYVCCLSGELWLRLTAASPAGTISPHVADPASITAASDSPASSHRSNRKPIPYIQSSSQLGGFSVKLRVLSWLLLLLLFSL